MFHALQALALLAIVSAAEPTDEDKDLELIPMQIGAEQRSSGAGTDVPLGSSASLQGRAYVEDAFTAGTSRRTLLVPFPWRVPDYSWQNRSSLDLSYRWAPLPRLTFTLSDRANIFEESDVKFPSSRTFRNDLREVYATWESLPRVYLEAGRINLRSGVALGFNPTDFFKTGSLVGQASQDPSVIRENRLGTLMARAQFIWGGGSSTVAFAPKVASPPALSSVEPALDPRFAGTNSANRLLCAISFELAGLSPQILAYFEQNRSRVGVNLSRSLGTSVIGYAEWAGGSQPDLITRGIHYGQETGTLPAWAPTIPATDTSPSWHNDLAAGASWTSAWRVTANLEYHFHQAGLSKRQWDRWFDLGRAPGASILTAPELWYLRGYANAQQEPASMHQVFARAEWRDALVSHLDLRAFGIVSVVDASVFGQVSVVYSWHDAWTAGAYFAFSEGAARSEHGSTPRFAAGTLQIMRFL